MSEVEQPVGAMASAGVRSEGSQSTGFRVVLAQTPEQIRDHHRLRYQVYCQQRGFEPGLAGDEEHDRHDAHAIRFVAYDAKGEPCGALRLVPAAPAFPAAAVTELQQSRLSGLGPRVMELSRLCLRHPDGRASGEWQQGSDLMLALCYAAWRHCRQHGVSHWLCLITPAMERLLGRLAVPFEVVGARCEYRGTRTPLLTDIQRLMRAAASKCERVGRLAAA